MDIPELERIVIVRLKSVINANKGQIKVLFGQCIFIITFTHIGIPSSVRGTVSMYRQEKSYKIIIIIEKKKK